MRGGYVIVAGAVAAVLLGVLQVNRTEGTGQPPYVATIATTPGVIAPVPAPDPALTAGDVAGPLAAVLADLRRSDAARTEAWVAEGYSSDLQALIDTADDASGTNPLNVNARRFSTDGFAYLDQNEDGLQPGWQGGYAQLRADLNTLAADTGLTPVPVPPGATGLSAKPDMTLPWQPPAQPASAACTAAVTNSASSTGAHSQSVKTTCGTTAVTNKTSVSKAGVVTNTTTTTTASG